MKIVIVNIFLFTMLLGYAQNDRKFIQSGNELYRKKEYSKALKDYEKATKQNPNRFEGQFNEADALYKSGKYEEASAKFSTAASLTKDKEKLSKTYHNLGNSNLKAKKYQESIDAYKNALKANSKDEQTRYNLAYAQKMLQQQKQQEKQNQDQDKENKEDQKKDEQKDKKDQENKENQKKEDQKNKDESKKNQQQKPQMSKEDADHMLKAIENQERDLQEQRKQKMLKGKKVIIEKDW